MEPETKYCDKCRRTLKIINFYKSNNLEKYPDGYLNQCKKCISMHVDNWNPDTFLWILQEADVPYIPDEWNSLMAKYAKNRQAVTGATILGRYLGKMRVKQYKDYRWKDTDFLRELSLQRVEEAMRQRNFDQQEIAATLNEMNFQVPQEPLPQPSYTETALDPVSSSFGIAPPEPAQEWDDFESKLSDEDKVYLRLKWGKNYKAEEWVALEQLYNEMLNSYDIQAAGDLNTLKIACKSSLKANQLLDIGDIDGAQKATKMYNDLMKSGKWTAAQNKAEEGEFVDSIGELIELCEKQGYIERFYVDEPNDKIDFAIQDMQRYTRTLIEGETDLSGLIEEAIKKNAQEDEDLSNNYEDSIIDENDLALEDIERSLQDREFEDYFDVPELNEEALAAKEN